MTIQEAIKSGKPYRRKIWNHWVEPDAILSFGDGKEHILANDWEIKLEPFSFKMPVPDEPQGLFYSVPIRVNDLERFAGKTVKVTIEAIA